MVHQLESELYSLISFLLHIFRAIKKAIISWKRRTEPPISSHKQLKYITLETKAESKIFMHEVVNNGSVSKLEECVKVPRKARKRPAMIAVPQVNVDSDFVEAGKEKKGFEEKDVEVEESGYCIVSRRGKSRYVMEDGYQVLTNINGDSKQAFFGVFDGHGGRAAVDFVSEKLGSNIIAVVSQLEEVNQIEMAIRAGYLTTDREFLSQDVKSGACATTVLLKNGVMHASNVGDCRIVLSKNGVATTLTRDHCAGSEDELTRDHCAARDHCAGSEDELTRDHCAGSEDERSRIECSGGYVSCHNGVWRVDDTLVVTRAIGDACLKKWVIGEPETKRLRLTPDCEFLIMASDGLWDKVTNQEAVDVVARDINTMMESCKTLVDMSVRRGGRDDITVMMVNLQRLIELEV